MKKGSFLRGAVGGAVVAAILSLGALSVFHIKSNLYAEHVAYAMGGIPVLSFVSLNYLKTCPEGETCLPEGESLVGRLMVFYAESDQALADTLLKCGHSLEESDAYGLRPLHSAVLSENIEAVRYLISKGVDHKAVISPDGNKHAGQTALEFAQDLRGQAEDKTKLDRIVLYLEEVSAG